MSGSSENIRVLHVDDEPGFSEMAAEFVARQDDRLDIETATNASEALDRLSDYTVDCVVSDFDMPGRNGIEFLEAVREDYPDLPFVLYTGKGSEEVASEAISAGVTEYLQKEAGTSQYEVLAKRITNAVERDRARRTAAETEQRLQTIAQNTNDMLWKFTADWNELLFINSPYEEIWGRSIDELQKEPQSFLKGIHPDDRAAVTDAMDRLSAGESVDIEFRVNADEDYGPWVWVQGEPVTDATGDVEKVLGFARDITARKQRERALAEQREDLRLFERAVEGSTDLLAAVNTEYNFLFGNEKYRDFHGLPAEGIAEYSLPEILDDEWGMAVKEHIDRAIAGEEVQYEMDRKGASGEIRSFDLRNYPLTDENGDIRGIVGAMRDITERKEREREITRLNELHETVLSNIRETVLVSEDDGQFTYVCPNVHFIFGYDAQEVADLGTVEALFGEQLIDPEVLEADGELTNIETTITDNEGDSHTVLVTVRQVDIEEGSRLYSIRDISERQERKRVLRERNRQLQGVLDSVQAAIWIRDLDSRFELVNQNFRDLFGLDDDTEVVGKRPSNLFSEEIATQFRDNDQQVIAAGEQVEIQEELPTERGLRTYLTRITPLFDEDDELFGTCGVASDITHRFQQERKITELHDVAIDIAAGDSARAICERAVEASQELLDFDLSGIDLVEHGDLVKTSASVETFPRGTTTMPIEEGIAGKTYRTGQSYLIREVAEHEEARPQGPYRSAISIPLGEHGVFQAVDEQPDAFDMDDLEIAELLIMHATQALDRLQREQSLRRQNERLDEFASVVSHDLRNPLSAAEGYLELVQEDCDSEDLADLSRTLERMRTILDNLLSLARAGETVGSQEPVNLAEISQRCWANVETAEATLQTESDQVILADESRLGQLFENLFRNAVEHGGEDVTLTVGDIDNGFYVADDGPGIPEEERDAVLEPGYSTNEQGTGFGLSIVRDIADAHGWDIYITRADGGGARLEFSKIDTE